MAFAVKCVIALVITAMAASLAADEKRWDSLQDEAISLYQQKKYQAAVDTQKLALDEAKATFGDGHMNVAESMDNLAIYYQGLGDNVTAEELYQKALGILEKSLSPNDHYLAIFMNYVAGFYRRIGRPDEAKYLEEKARAIRKANVAGGR